MVRTQRRTNISSFLICRRKNSLTVVNPFAYPDQVAETTAHWFSSQERYRRTTAPERFFYVRTPLRASKINGRAVAGKPSGLPGSCISGLLTLLRACPPHLAVGAGLSLIQEAAMRANAPARSEQPKPQSFVQRFPLFARAGSTAADLWLNFPVLTMADFRDLRFRNMVSGLPYSVDDHARRIAFNDAFAARIASSIAERSYVEAHHV